MKMLCPALANSSVTCLDLSKCHLGPDATYLLAGAVSDRTPARPAWNEVKTNSTGCPEVAHQHGEEEHWTHSGERMYTLDSKEDKLALGNTNIGWADLTLIAAWLDCKSGSKIKALDLTGCSIAGATYHVNKSAHHVHASSYYKKDFHLSGLEKLVATQTSSRRASFDGACLEEIVLKDCHLGKSGGACLCPLFESLAVSKSSIRVVNLKGDNDLGPSCLRAIKDLKRKQKQVGNSVKVYTNQRFS